MIDTTIEIRSSDRDWLVKSLRFLADNIEAQTFNWGHGVMSGHNYDVSYQIKKVEEIL